MNRTKKLFFAIFTQFFLLLCYWLAVYNEKYTTKKICNLQIPEIHIRLYSYRLMFWGKSLSGCEI